MNQNKSSKRIIKLGPHYKSQPKIQQKDHQVLSKLHITAQNSSKPISPEQPLNLTPKTCQNSGPQYK